MGGIGHEMVIRSKKRQFLRFFVTYWTTDDYTNVNLSSDGLEKINLRKVRFRCAKDHVSSCERWCLRRWKLTFHAAKPKWWEKIEWKIMKWRMKNEGWKVVFTDFNFSFITFPRQVFVGFFHVVFQKGGNAVGIMFGLWCIGWNAVMFGLYWNE